MTEYLMCHECGGDGRVLYAYGDITAIEPCESCNGRGVRTCVETRCNEPAVFLFEEHPLCAVHYLLWCNEAEA